MEEKTKQEHKKEIEEVLENVGAQRIEYKEWPVEKYEDKELLIIK